MDVFEELVILVPKFHHEETITAYIQTCHINVEPPKMPNSLAFSRVTEGIVDVSNGFVGAADVCLRPHCLFFGRYLTNTFWRVLLREEIPFPPCMFKALKNNEINLNYLNW